MRKGFLVITVVYTVLIISFFDAVSRLSDSIYELIGPERYDFYIVGSEVVLLIPLVLLVALKSFRGDSPAWKLSAWGAYFIVLYIAGSRLIINRIEHIHYIEYAILSMLLFLAYRRYLSAFWVGSLVGLLDEQLQAWRVPHPLDLNDVYFNFLGVLGGLLLAWTFLRTPAPGLSHRE